MHLQSINRFQYIYIYKYQSTYRNDSVIFPIHVYIAKEYMCTYVAVYYLCNSDICIVCIHCNREENGGPDPA